MWRRGREVREEREARDEGVTGRGGDGERERRGEGERERRRVEA